jgi:hypothetical protein
VSAQPPPSPPVSPDGKFYWDGQRWVPLQTPPQPISPPTGPRPAVTAGVVTLVGCGIAIVGTFLPWISAIGPFGISISKAGIDGDGKFVVGVALICAADAAFTLLRRPASVAVGLIVFLFGLGQLGLVIWIGSNISNGIASLPSQSLIDASIGVGVYVSGLGAIISAAGGVMAWVAGSGRAGSAPTPAQAPAMNYAQPVTGGPRVGTRSPDGHTVWDGTAWCNLDGDARHFWNGRDWRPVEDLVPPSA